MVFVALSHYYLLDRGNVLALSSINPRGCWTHDMRESFEFEEELAKIFVSLH